MNLTKSELAIFNKLNMIISGYTFGQQFDNYIAQDYAVNKALLESLRDLTSAINNSSLLHQIKLILHDPYLFPVTTYDDSSNGTTPAPPSPGWMDKLIAELTKAVSDIVVPILKEIVANTILPGIASVMDQMTGSLDSAIRYEANTFKAAIDKQVQSFESRLNEQIDIIKKAAEDKIDAAKKVAEKQIDAMKSNFQHATDTFINITNQTTTWAEKQVFGSQAWNVSKWFPENRNVTDLNALYSWWNPFDGIINTLLDGLAKLFQLIMKIIVSDLVAPLISKIIEVLVATFVLDVELWYPVFIKLLNFTICMIVTIVYVVDKTVKLVEILFVFLVIMKLGKFKLIPTCIITGFVSIFIGVIRPQGYPSILGAYLKAYGTTIADCKLPDI